MKGDFGDAWRVMGRCSPKNGTPGSLDSRRGRGNLRRYLLSDDDDSDDDDSDDDLDDDSDDDLHR